MYTYKKTFKTNLMLLIGFSILIIGSASYAASKTVPPKKLPKNQKAAKLAAEKAASEKKRKREISKAQKAINKKGGKSFVYTVRPNDSLSFIAKTFLQDPTKWPELLAYNQIPKPDLIHPGQKIVVPQWLRKSAMGRVSRKTGKAQHQGFPDKVWKELRGRKEIYTNDGIVTKQKSFVDVNLGRITEIQVLPESLVYFDMKLSKKLQSQRVLLQRGRMFSKFKRNLARNKGKLKGKKVKAKLPKAKAFKFRRLRLKTPTARIAVKGTEFLTVVDAKQTTELTTIEGKVAVTGKRKTVTVPRGYYTIVKKNREPTPPRPLPQALELQISN